MPSASMRKLLEAAGQEYQMQLLETTEGEKAIRYLASRGLNQKTVESFRLGYVLTPMPGHDLYQGRLAIPYLTPAGITTIRYRALDDSNPKYLSMPGDQVRIFNPAALANRKVFIAEGEIDAITAVQAGLPTVGLPGANSWIKLWKRCFRYRDVTVLVDNDDDGSGQKMAEKMTEELYGCRIVKMPKGHDVNSFTVANGEKALREMVM